LDRIVAACQIVLAVTKVERLKNHAAAHMGVGRIFSCGGSESGEICFFPLEIEKTSCFCCDFQNPSPFRRPWLKQTSRVSLELPWPRISMFCCDKRGACADWHWERV